VSARAHKKINDAQQTGTAVEYERFSISEANVIFLQNNSESGDDPKMYNIPRLVIPSEI